MLSIASKFLPRHTAGHSSRTSGSVVDGGAVSAERQPESIRAGLPHTGTASDSMLPSPTFLTHIVLGKEGHLDRRVIEEARAAVHHDLEVLLVSLLRRRVVENLLIRQRSHWE